MSATEALAGERDRILVWERRIARGRQIPVRQGGRHECFWTRYQSLVEGRFLRMAEVECEREAQY